MMLRDKFGRMFRKFTLLLLLITLPLRLWAAESMNFQFVQPASMSMQVFEQDDAAMMDDCPMMKSQSAQGRHDIGSKSGKYSCKACQLCMSFGFSHSRILFFAPENQNLIPEVSGRSFISADLAHLSKPPIP